jgi:hypothetical protein
MKNRKTSFDGNFESFTSPISRKFSGNELPSMLEAIAEDVNEERLSAM